MPRAGGPHAVDVQLRFVADGMVSRLPPRAGEVSAAARSGFQHAIRTAVEWKSGHGGREELCGSAFVGSGSGAQVQFAHGNGHYELFDMPSVILGSARLQSCQIIGL